MNILTYLLLLIAQQTSPCMQGLGSTAPAVVPYCNGIADINCVTACIFDYSNSKRSSNQQYCTDVENAWNTYDQLEQVCETEFDHCVAIGNPEYLCTGQFNDCLSNATQILSDQLNAALSARQAREAVIEATFIDCCAACCHE